MSRLLSGFKWQSASLIITAALGAATGSFLLLHWYFKNNLKVEDKKKKRKLSDAEAETNSTKETVYLPPLPDPVVQLLRASKLCFLATQSDGEPHLSLMNFTYWHKGDIIILCTRRDTKKYNQIMKNTKVAVLIHDFPHLNTPGVDDDSHGKSWSITLNGACVVLEQGNEEGEKLRAIHFKNNPDYSQFINGDDIAVIKIIVEKARMCDINDRVSYWNVKDGFVGSD